MISSGMLKRPARTVSATSITGEEKWAISSSVTEPIADTAIPTSRPNGIAANNSIGKESDRASQIPTDGYRRSLNLTQIDYARGMSLEVLIVAEEGFLPTYANPGDAGADLRSTEDVVIPARGRALVKTGVRIALPNGFVALVHPRSGLAAKSGITVLNTPGTVDAGYRGELMVTLYNTTDTDFSVNRGDRIAQLLIQQVEHANFIAVSELPDSARGTGGFGSSGKN